MLAAAGTVLLFLRGGAFAGTATVGQALSLAEEAFASVPVRGDVAFWLSQGARNAGRTMSLSLDPEVKASAAQGLLKYDYYLWVHKGLDVEVVPVTALAVADAAYQRNYLGSLDDGGDPQRVRMTLAVMVKAIDCVPGEPYPSDLLTPDYGYVATHQLLAVLIAHQRGCVDTEVYQKTAGALLRRIANEMRDFPGGLNDLQVERAAALTLFGFSEQVPAEMVTMLLEQQLKSGLWAFVFSDRHNMNIVMHNSALAYMVLSGQYAAPLATQ